MKVSFILSCPLAALAVLCQAHAIRMRRRPLLAVDDFGPVGGTSMLQSGVQFGKVYSEVSVLSRPDGSFVVVFRGGPGENPEVSPEEIPGGNPEVSPEETPGEYPEQLPEQTPEENPEANHEENSEVIPEENTGANSEQPPAGESEEAGQLEDHVTELPNASGTDPEIACLHRENVGSKSAELGTKVVGGDTVEDAVKQCRQWCLSLEKCTHFTYNSSSKRCHVKKGRPIFYQYPGDVTASKSCDFSCFVKNVAYTNAPIVAPTLKTNLATDCQAACEGEPKCRVFIWHASESMCYLKGDGFSKFKVRREGTIAGPKVSCEQGGSLLEAEENDRNQDFVTALPNAVDSDPDLRCVHRQDTGSKAKDLKQKKLDAGDPLKSAKECQAWCRTMDECSHMVYNKNSKTCFAKKDRPVFYKYTGDVSGARSCDFSCFVKNKAYTKAPVVAPTLSTNLATDCQAACQAEPKCRVFIWHADENKCYLKGDGFSKFKDRKEGTIAGPKVSCEQGGSLAETERED